MNQTEITMENTNDFDILLINKGSISEYSYNDPNYIAKIFKLGLCKTLSVNKDTFLRTIATNLETDKYDKVTVSNEIVGEEPYYIYELLYINLNEKYHETKNELASLININEDIIYSNAIIIKTHIPSLSDSMVCESVNISDMERVLYERVYNKIVIYRNYEYSEDQTHNLDEYAKTFFEGEYYTKLELAFLSHNINIWYVSELGEKNVCGKLIDGLVEKCIWFTMKSDDYKGNLSLDEVKKIIYLSNKLEDYKPQSDWLNPKCDKFDRLIIKNKYRILDDIYNKYK
jgi:hypothetical protein